MEQLIANLKVCAAVKQIERLVGLDVIVRARLKAGFAVLLDHLESLSGIIACDLHDDLVGLGVDVAFARRGVLALCSHGGLSRSFPVQLIAQACPG